MGKYRPDKQLNERCASQPEPGDYWQEMLCGAAIVLAVSETDVTICRTKKDAGPGRWTWDLTKAEKMGRDEFERYVRYDTNDGFWCDVMPGAHRDFVPLFEAT